MEYLRALSSKGARTEINLNRLGGCMRDLIGFESEVIRISDAVVEVHSKGAGRPILFLHPGQGLHGSADALNELVRSGRVIVPIHPGFGRTELPHSFTGVDDLAYMYLDYLTRADLKDVVLIGASFGGWIAAEMAVIDSCRISSLVLVDSLGVKFGRREDRDIADMHALSEEQLGQLLYVNPEKHRPNYSSMSDDELIEVARSRESFAFLGWKPYMHNPKLRQRLHRIAIPALVLWGQHDRIVSPQYGRALSSEIPNSRFELIDQAAHLPFVEQPGRFARQVERFITTH
jgi:pimeloyl-ACP methyl ester carboxylesterase